MGHPGNVPCDSLSLVDDATVDDATVDDVRVDDARMDARVRRAGPRHQTRGTPVSSVPYT
eukprot:308579-Chlamydomonas_euryale.AAC.2